MNDRLTNRICWMASIAFHLLLALAFLAINTKLPPFELEFSAISFSSFSEPGASGGAVLPEFGGKTPLVELPRRQTLDDTSPLLRLPYSERQTIEAPLPTDKPDLKSVKKFQNRQRLELNKPLTSTHERADFSTIPISDELLTGDRPDALGETIAGDEMFSISWEGQSRTKIGGKLPKFPRNIKRAITVKIAFEVTPDGLVSFAAPQTKGVPELEKVSLEALKTWRFNPLDKSQKMKKQKGMVTFVFRLK